MLNATISSIVRNVMFFNSILWTRRRMLLTKNMRKKKTKATEKEIRNSLDIYLKRREYPPLFSSNCLRLP